MNFGTVASKIGTVRSKIGTVQAHFGTVACKIRNGPILLTIH